MRHIKLFEAFHQPDHFFREFSKNIGSFETRKIFFITEMKDIFFDDIDDSLITRIDDSDDFINLVNSQMDPLLLWLYYTPTSKMNNELTRIKDKKFILLEGEAMYKGENIQKNLGGEVEQYFI
jgi:hypothetical protein